MKKNIADSYVSLKDVFAALTDENKPDTLIIPSDNAAKLMNLNAITIKEGSAVRDELSIDEKEDLKVFDHVLRHGPEAGDERQEEYAKYIELLFGYNEVGFLEGERATLCALYDIPVEFSFYATDYWNKAEAEFGTLSSPFQNVRFRDEAACDLDTDSLDDPSDIEF